MSIARPARRPSRRFLSTTSMQCWRSSTFGTKGDFRGYKTETLQRRIQRRMRLQQIEQVSEYVDFLRAHPEEVDRLFKDLLIGVTRFFRDPSAFDELATRVLATLVKGRRADSPVRIWVPGCATGEEAYSLAIVAAEQVAAAGSRCRVQIFATDLDEDAIGIARAGVYPESIALDVTPCAFGALLYARRSTGTSSPSRSASRSSSRSRT